VICQSWGTGVFCSLYKSKTDKGGAEIDSNLATVLLGGLILFVAVLLAVSGLIFVQHRVPLEVRQSHNVPIGVIYGALSVTFGVIIGFSAYLVLNKYTTSQTTVANEAGGVRALYHLAGQFPEPERDRIQDLTISYARAVVDEEWPLMEKGQSSPQAATLDQQLTVSVNSFQPSTSAEQALYSQALQKTYDVNQGRTLRLLYASTGLPPILWFVLGVLAVTIVLFSYFLGMENTLLHILAVSALTVGLTFTMFTTIILDHPFGGALRVSSNAFEVVLTEIEGESQSET
jgi:hypothetical protein